MPDEKRKRLAEVLCTALVELRGDAEQLNLTSKYLVSTSATCKRVAASLHKVAATIEAEL